VPSYFGFILYWILWFSGLYCLLNFGLFAGFAEATKDEMISPSKEKGTIEEVIVRRTVWKWKRTYIRRIFVWLKLRPLKEVKKYEEVTILRLGDFLTFGYFLFAFFTSSMFFTELSNNILVLIIYTILWTLFGYDLITTVRQALK